VAQQRAPSEDEPSVRAVTLPRLTSFSDGVFAVAITLLVLTIRVRLDLPLEKVGHELRAQWPHFVAYVVSFAIIGVFWISHHGVFNMLKRANGPLIWLNLAFLMVIVFIPFPTELISEYSNSEIVVILYAATMACAGLMLALMTWYATWENRLVAADFDHLRSSHLIEQFLAMAGVFLVSIGVALVSVSAAEFFWLAIIALDVFLEIRHKRKKSARVNSAS